MHKRARWTFPIAIATVAIALTAAPAVACGGLVGENGTIQLTRTVTLAAYRQGATPPGATVLILSGGNVEPRMLQEILAESD